MSNIQIPNLPAVTALSGEELFEGVQAGSSVKIRLGQIISAVRVGLPTTIPLPVIDGGTGVTTSTGTGSVVLSDNPTLVSPSINVGTFGLGTVGAPSITFTGDTNTGIWSPGADTVAISTGGAERMRVASTGFVGIGTTAPAQPLHIATSGATIAAAYVQNDTGNAGYFLRSQDTGVNTIYFGDTTDFQAGFIQYSHAIDTLLSRSAGPVVFQAGGSNERMRINSAGNVGIGTNNPAVKLDVLGDGLVVRANSVTSNNSYMRFDGTGTSFPFIGLIAGIGTFGNTDASPIRFNTNTLERMRIDSAGLVGIGTTLPLANLHVNRASGAADIRLSVADVSYGNLFSSASGTTLSNITAAPLIFSTTNTERVRVHSNGGVSINNITDPGAGNLSVTGNILIPAATTETRAIEIGSGRAGNGTSFVDLIGDATYTDYGARLARGATGANTDTTLYHRGTGALQLLAQDAGIVALYTAAAERFRAGPAGQFGIGGANYGTAGQAFISGGPSAATSWGTLGLAGGGTGVTTAPAAAAVLYGYTSTATSGGTTVLDNTSSQYQLFTGVSVHSITLPVASTLTTGWTFHIVNSSTQNLTVRSSGANLVGTVIPGTTAMITCILASGTNAASWEFGVTDFNTLTGTGSVVMSNSPTLVTPTLGTGSFDLGAVATPSITFTGDTNTGIWSPAADTVAVSTNGAEVARVFPSGGVSIGNTTDPGATNLSVTGAVRSATSLLSSGAGGVGYSTGAGVAVTQLTSRTTPVPTTGNKTSGSITLFTTTAVVGSWFSFTVPNTAIAITDTVSLTVRGATNSYLACVTAIAAGTSFTVTMASLVGTASDTPIVNFNIIRGVSA